MKILLLSILILLGTFSAAVIVPFFSWDNTCYNQVAADAAEMFDLDINEFNIVFSRNVVSASGQPVQGVFRTSKTEEKKTIEINTSWSRPMVISTIFHEFAHAAQYKHELCGGDLNHEQHAEALAFDAMWNSKYWWNAVHMLTLHMAAGKPADYRTPASLWNIAIGR